MGFLTNPKTGRIMAPEDLFKREVKEWGEAFGTFGRELFGAGKTGGKKMFVTSEAELRKMLGSVHDFKRR